MLKAAEPTAFIKARISVDSNGCWNWTGMRNGKGYGRVQLRRSVTTGAHRFSWQAFKGEVLGDLCVLHRCDNKLCVNPEHLFLGTEQDNTDDMVQKGRQVTPLGEAHGKSKLTAEIVQDIRQRVLDGFTQTSSAKLYSITSANVSMVIKRQTWKHV